MISNTYRISTSFHLYLSLLLLVSTSFARSGGSDTLLPQFDHGQNWHTDAPNTRQHLPPISELIEQLEARSRADRIAAEQEILKRKDDQTVEALLQLIAKDDPSDPRNGGRAHSIRRAKELLAQMSQAMSCSELNLALEEGLNRYAAESPSVAAMDLIQEIVIGDSENYAALASVMKSVDDLRKQMEKEAESSKKPRAVEKLKGKESEEETIKHAIDGRKDPLPPVRESEKKVQMCMPLPTNYYSDTFYALRDKRREAWFGMGEVYYNALNSEAAKKAGITIQKRHKGNLSTLLSDLSLDVYELTIQGTQYIARLDSDGLSLHVRPGSKTNFSAPLSEVIAPQWTGTGEDKKRLVPSISNFDQVVELNLGVRADHFSGDYTTIQDSPSNIKQVAEQEAANWRNVFFSGLPDLVERLNCTPERAHPSEAETRTYYERLNKARQISPINPQVRKKREAEHPFPKVKHESFGIPIPC